MKITCMRGFSGSGKSTRAAEIAKETGAVVVNRDLLRLMLLGTYWTGKTVDEERVTVAEEAQVVALLKAGADVVIDSTHLNPPFLRKWAKLATRMGVEFEVVDMIAPMEACAAADYARGTLGERSVGMDVIKAQAKRWPVEKWPTITAEPFIVEPVKPFVKLGLSSVIVDLDGTLAHIPEDGRSPYDYSRVGEDLVDEALRELVNKMIQTGYIIILLSGRDDNCRNATIEWLSKSKVDYDYLYMRPADAKDARGNKLPDYQVKYDLFNKHVRDKHNVAFVLDDRQQVVDMWR